LGFSAKIILSLIRGSSVRTKRLLYILILIIALLVIINIYQYNRNSDFERTIGYEYQRTVIDTIFVLEEGDVNLWLKILQEKDGQFTLERHVGELTLLSRKYHMMNGKISMIGDQLDSLANQYHELANNFKSNMDYKHNEKEILNRSEFLISLMNEMDSISGENERRYYREFTNSDSRTSTLVWRECKKYEKQ
jgi:hypothetical protein